MNPNPEALKADQIEQSATPEEQVVEETGAKLDTMNEGVQAQIEGDLDALDATQEAQGEIQDLNEQITQKPEDQKLAENLEKLSKLQIADDRIFLNAEQVSALSTLSLMLNAAPAATPTPAQMQAAERAALLDDPKLLRQERRDIKKEIRKEKKLKKELEKTNRKLVTLDNQKNSTNYSYKQMQILQQMRTVLNSGEYINQSFAFIQEQPLILDLLEHYPQHSSLPQFTILHDKKKIIVNNEAVIPHASVAAMNHFHGRPGRTDGYDNALHQLATEKTKMSSDQARNMVNTLGVAGLAAGAFFLGRWLFFSKRNDKGKRKLGTTWGKMAGLIGIPLAANFASQAATGEGFMHHLQRLRTEGKTPWDKDTIANASEHQRISIGQNMVHYILLGAPYAVLAQCATPQTGKVTSMDIKKLQEYYTAKAKEAEANNDGTNQAVYNTQLKALAEINNNNEAQNLFNTTIASMNIDADTLKDPDNGQQTLNEQIYQRSERYQNFEHFLQNREYIIHPNKKSEVDKLLFTKNVDKKFEESDFNKMIKEGLLLPNDKYYQEINKLNLLESDKLDFHKNFKKMAGKPEYNGLDFKVVDDHQVTIISNGKETMLNLAKRKLPGLKNSAGEDLVFSTKKELMELGLFINALRANDKEIWGVEPDGKRKGDENWPFDLAGGISQVWKGVQSIEFKKHNGGVVVMNNLLPFFSEMDLKFPTIEKGDNRVFLVQYLNKLRKEDHPDQ